jgi:hypothetical protein
MVCSSSFDEPFILSRAARGVDPEMNNTFLVLRCRLGLVHRSIQTTLGLAVGLTLLSFSALSAQAQTANTVQPLQDFKPNDSGSDIFNNRGGGQSNFMNFIQNAIQGSNARPADEVASEQQQNLNDAAAQFRARQSELLRKPKPAPSLAPELTPTPAIQPSGN